MYSIYVNGKAYGEAESVGLSAAGKDMCIAFTDLRVNDKKLRRALPPICSKNLFQYLDDTGKRLLFIGKSVETVISVQSSDDIEYDNLKHLSRTWGKNSYSAKPIGTFKKNHQVFSPDGLYRVFVVEDTLVVAGLNDYALIGLSPISVYQHSETNSTTDRFMIGSSKHDNPVTHVLIDIDKIGSKRRTKEAYDSITIDVPKLLIPTNSPKEDEMSKVLLKLQRGNDTTEQYDELLILSVSYGDHALVLFDAKSNGHPFGRHEYTVSDNKGGLILTDVLTKATLEVIPVSAESRKTLEDIRDYFNEGIAIPIPKPILRLTDRNGRVLEFDKYVIEGRGVKLTGPNDSVSYLSADALALPQTYNRSMRLRPKDKDTIGFHDVSLIDDSTDIAIMDEIYAALSEREVIGTLAKIRAGMPFRTGIVSISRHEFKPLPDLRTYGTKLITGNGSLLALAEEYDFYKEDAGTYTLLGRDTKAEYSIIPRPGYNSDVHGRSISAMDWVVEQSERARKHAPVEDRDVIGYTTIIGPTQDNKNGAPVIVAYRIPVYSYSLFSSGVSSTLSLVTERGDFMFRNTSSFVRRTENPRDSSMHSEWVIGDADDKRSNILELISFTDTDEFTQKANQFCVQTNAYDISGEYGSSVANVYKAETIDGVSCVTEVHEVIACRTNAISSGGDVTLTLIDNSNNAVNLSNTDWSYIQIGPNAWVLSAKDKPSITLASNDHVSYFKKVFQHFRNTELPDNQGKKDIRIGRIYTLSIENGVPLIHSSNTIVSANMTEKDNDLKALALVTPDGCTTTIDTDSTCRPMKDYHKDADERVWVFHDAKAGVSVTVVAMDDSFYQMMAGEYTKVFDTIKDSISVSGEQATCMSQVYDMANAMARRLVTETLNVSSKDPMDFDVSYSRDIPETTMGVRVNMSIVIN